MGRRKKEGGGSESGARVPLWYIQKKLPPVLAFCVDFIRERKKGGKKEKEREVFISGEETLESWEKGKGREDLQLRTAAASFDRRRIAKAD